MRHSKKIFLIGLCLSISGCGTQNRGVESVHQPVVSRTDYVFDASAGYDGLASGDASRLEGWFQSLRLGYGDRIAVDLGRSGTNSSARDSVAAIAARYGLLLDASAPVTTGDIAPGMIRVIISRAVASVPGCPDWSRPSEPNFNSHSGSNFGCGVNSNLAAMIADPRDLIIGRSLDGSIDVTTSGKAIKSYRNSKPTGENGLKNESSKGSGQ